MLSTALLNLTIFSYSRQGLETVQQSVLADIYNFCHRNKQLARELISRESSTSEDGDSLVGHDFSEKESDDERAESPSENMDDFARNGKIISTLQSLAARETKKTKEQGSNEVVANKSSVKEHLINSVKQKRRFKITKIMELQSSSGIYNKIANVWNDSSESSSKKEVSMTSGGSAASSAVDDRNDAAWRGGLQRQPNVESPTPNDTGKLSSPVRSRNTELKEFYRRLKDGDMNSTGSILTEKQLDTNDLKVENSFDKMPFPGKAQKLNDAITDNLKDNASQGVAEESDSVDPLDAGAFNHSKSQITNVTGSID